VEDLLRCFGYYHGCGWGAVLHVLQLVGRSFCVEDIAGCVASLGAG